MWGACKADYESFMREEIVFGEPDAFAGCAENKIKVSRKIEAGKRHRRRSISFSQN
ncbi:MAG: hypothetical protein ACLTLQ_05365 [[Clostridium] scindens]